MNRNFGFKWGQGDNSDNPCLDTYRGPQAFSEPESRALRDFVTSKKDEIKFVYNFHSAGKLFFTPYVGQFPNSLSQEYPWISQVYDEISNEAKFPVGTAFGPAYENLGIVAGGDAGDWITHSLGIPASEAEISAWEDLQYNWFPFDNARSFRIVNENLDWLEHTYKKIGNQIKIEPIGYTRSLENGKQLAILKMNITNLGLSDQIHDDIKLNFNNQNLKILSTNQKDGAPSLLVQEEENYHDNVRL